MAILNKGNKKCLLCAQNSCQSVICDLFKTQRFNATWSTVIKNYASKPAFFLHEPFYPFLEPGLFLFHLPIPVRISVSNLLGFATLRSIYAPNKSIYPNNLYKLLEFYTKGKLYIGMIRNISVQHFVFYFLHKLANSRLNIQKLEQNLSPVRVDLTHK